MTYRCYTFFCYLQLKQTSYYYPLTNEVAKRYSNATVRPSFHPPSFRNILVNTLESTSFMDFDQTWYTLSP
jgi:hypothetical protein